MRYPLPLPLVLAGTIIALAFLGAQAFGQDAPPNAMTDAPPPPEQPLPPGVTIEKLGVLCFADGEGFMADALIGKYRENVLHMGRSEDGAVGFWGSPAGTFTVTIARQDGSVCMVSSGDGLEPQVGEAS